MKDAMNEKEGFEYSAVINGKMALPYTYFAGKTGSFFLTAIRDRKKIFGTRCPRCGKVYVPPRQTCELDLAPLQDNWVEVGSRGVITNFTVVRYDDRHLPRKAPFVLAMILLEGADTPLLHIVEGIPADEVATGMRVEAVFGGRETSTILAIDHFIPAGGGESHDGANRS